MLMFLQLVYLHKNVFIEKYILGFLHMEQYLLILIIQHQKILGRDTFGRFEWRDEGHLDSPWRLRNKLFEVFTNTTCYKKYEHPYN